MRGKWHENTKFVSLLVIVSMIWLGFVWEQLHQPGSRELIEAVASVLSRFGESVAYCSGILFIGFGGGVWILMSLYTAYAISYRTFKLPASIRHLIDV